MTDSIKLRVDRRDGLAIIYTDGYINNQGGEEIARTAYELIDEGYTSLLLNLEQTKIVNSIGISILIEVIEKSGYQALPWVRYITRSGNYEFRLAHQPAT